MLPRLTVALTFDFDAIKEREGVVFGRLDEYSDRWRQANPLDKWLQSEPIHARITAPDGLSRPRTG